jgi:hypothetical protein
LHLLTIAFTVKVEPLERDNNATRPDTLHDDASASEPDGRIKNNLLGGLFTRKKKDADSNDVATEPSEKELFAQQSEKSAVAPPRDKKVSPLAGRNPGKYLG